MSDRHWALRPATRRLWPVGAALTGLVAAGLPTTATTAAPPDSCPSAIPVREVTDGMPVHGLTTTSGTTPEAFTGEVLGVLDDAIAPGLDLIMVRLQGASITDANGDVKNGVWAGMSGSPVYTQDGRLLGAVAYGLSWSPSDVAGVTPAADMLELTSNPTGGAPRTTAGARRIDLTARDAESAGLSGAEARGGFQRLPMPFAVSGGFSTKRLAKVADRFELKRRLIAGSSADTSAAPPPAIVPGGNLVASLSYGDITYAGTGTATAVCGRQVLGFGHPLLWEGRSTYSMHNADAIYIQRDDTLGSYKLANPSAPLGAVVQDRLAGILGINGVTPASTGVTSHVESVTGGSRDGETVITHRRYTPFLAAIHLLANADRVLDKIGPGSARMSWTVQGTRSDGSPWQYTRTNRYASGYDITFSSVYESYQQLSKLLANGIEPVRITDVHFEAGYDPKYHALKLTGLEARIRGEWVTIGNGTNRIKVPAGSELRLRVTLDPSGHTDPLRRVGLSVQVPNKGRYGFLSVGAGDDVRLKASSFDDLLDELAGAPRNDEVTARLFTESRHGEITRTDTELVKDVVSGRKSIKVRIVH